MLKRSEFVLSSFAAALAGCVSLGGRETTVREKTGEAIQKAIDEMAAAGGGKVVVPAGVYVSGTIWLKSHVELHLEKDATIKGSANRADYCGPDAFPQNNASKGDNTSGGHLVVAVEQEDVAITGEGTIDGNSPAFNVGPDGKEWPGGKLAIPWRPGQMLFFAECRDVRVSGVRLVNSPYWTFLLYGCEDVEVDGLDVRTPRSPRTYNGDGIDVDACRNVVIRNCTIVTDDDSITFRAAGTRLRRRVNVCEGVLVENCRLSSICNAFRVGVGDGVVRNVTARNCEVFDTRFAVCLVAGYTKGSDGTAIEDVRFENLKVEADRMLVAYHRYTAGHTFRRIAFDGVTAKTKGESRIYADARWPFEDFSFRSVVSPKGFEALNVSRLTVEGGDFPSLAISTERAAKLNEGFRRNVFPVW